MAGWEEGGKASHSRDDTHFSVVTDGYFSRSWARLTSDLCYYTIMHLAWPAYQLADTSSAYSCHLVRSVDLN
ncbi:uncharacterized [Tachysurus ichikawai]